MASQVFWKSRRENEPTVVSRLAANIAGIGRHAGHDEGRVGASPAIRSTTPPTEAEREKEQDRIEDVMLSDARSPCATPDIALVTAKEYARSRGSVPSVLSQLAAGQAQGHVLEVRLAMPVDDVLRQLLGEGAGAST